MGCACVCDLSSSVSYCVCGFAAVIWAVSCGPDSVMFYMFFLERGHVMTSWWLSSLLPPPIRYGSHLDGQVDLSLKNGADQCVFTCTVPSILTHNILQ